MKKCPNCGKITDRKFCSSCGTSLIEVPEIDEQVEQDFIKEVQEEKATTEESAIENIEVSEENAGLKVEGETEQVPSSGEDATSNEVQKEEDAASKLEIVASVVNEKNSKQPASGKKKILIAAIAAVAVIVVAVVGISASNAAKAKAAQEAYDNAVLTMRANSGMMHLDVTGINLYEDKIDNMEELINLTNSVWHDSIYETQEDDTYKYIKGTSGFDEALNNLYMDSAVTDFNNQLSDHLELAKSGTTRELSTVPDSLSDAKAAYIKVFTAYQALVSWCEWPNGSYSTYMEQSQEKYDEFMDAYNEFDVLCPEWENPEDTDGSSETGDA